MIPSQNLFHVRRFTGSLAAALTLLSMSLSQAADWPQWRGPNRDGISAETGWTATFPASGPKIAWKINVGPGCSSFAVVGDQVFTMGNKEKDTGSIYCLDAKTGKTIWQHSYPSALEPKSFEGGQCGTPVVDGNDLFALGRQGQFFCLNKTTGAVIWQKDFQKDFGAKQPDWGFSGSPVVVGKAVLIDVGGKGASAVAFDRATGNVLWQAGDDAAAYSSPYAFSHNGKQCVAFFNAFGLVVRDAANGNEVMRYPWKTSYNVNPTTPIVSDNKVFISSGYGHGAALLPLVTGTVTPVWENKSMKNKMASSVLWNGNLYGFDETLLTCMDFATGTVKWQQKDFGLGSLMVADGKLIVLSDKGDLVIAEATPEAYKELAKASVAPGRTWVMPVLANGHIYCRNNAGDLVCVDVSGQ